MRGSEWVLYVSFRAWFQIGDCGDDRIIFQFIYRYGEWKERWLGFLF